MLEAAECMVAVVRRLVVVEKPTPAGLLWVSVIFCAVKG